MESFFLNLGLSYTWSKLLPYILMTIIGIWIGVFLFKRSKSLLTKILSIVAIGVPFGIYFAINPIYEGDFANGSRIIQHSTETNELQKGTLVVVSKPGCPYCKESIFFFRELKKRNPKIDIEYVVIPDSDIPENVILEYYTEVSKGEFPVRIAQNGNGILKLATDDYGIARFPTFVLVQENSLTAWTNNTFGVIALDEVLKSFK
jgi:thioredoxin-related protein